MPKTSRQRFGSAAEDAAADWLKHHAHVIRERNVSGPRGEIDIVAWDKKTKTLCFVEVRARDRAGDIEHPGESITPTKIRKIVLTAEWYMRTRKIPTDTVCRFDVVMIFRDADGRFDLQYIANAFTADEGGR